MAVVNKDQLKKGKTTAKHHSKEISIKNEIHEQSFLAKAEDYTQEFEQDLTKLSLTQLANQYVEIDRQSHILKGKILLEARSRFPSDKEFGQWISTHSLCVGSQQSRNRLMHLAEFFGDERDMNGIPLTVAYEISAPVNREKALQIYEKVIGKNVSIKEVKLMLVDNGVVEQPIIESLTEHKLNASPENIQSLVIDLVDNVMSDKPDELKLRILLDAIKYLKSKLSLKNNRFWILSKEGVRIFGSFSLKQFPVRIGRNPKSGKPVNIP